MPVVTSNRVQDLNDDDVQHVTLVQQEERYPLTLINTAASTVGLAVNSVGRLSRSFGLERVRSQTFDLVVASPFRTCGRVHQCDKSLRFFINCRFVGRMTTWSLSSIEAGGQVSLAKGIGRQTLSTIALRASRRIW